MLHREKRSLCTVKNLLTKFRGDNAFILCGSLDNPRYDGQIFNIKPIYSQLSTSKPHPLNTISPTTTTSDCEQVNDSPDIVDEGVDKAPAEPRNGQTRTDTRTTGIEHSFPLIRTTETEQTLTGAAESQSTISSKVHKVETGTIGSEGSMHDFILEEIERKDATISQGSSFEKVAACNEEQKNSPNLLPPQLLSHEKHGQSSTAENEGTNPISITAAASNASPIDNALLSPESLMEEPSTVGVNDGQSMLPTLTNGSTAGAQETKSTDDAEKEAIGEESQSAPRRMRTRAQAQAASDNSASSHTRTPSPAPWVPPVIHPLYLIPELARLDRDYGLPPNEAEDTRRLLTAYVQKQEEIVRGAEKLYEGLLRAERMRQTVFKWCKAEGHIGEMSDGEDWYDKEGWGLEEDLKKGHDDEEEDTAAQGKKTRKTRQQ